MSTSDIIQFAILIVAIIAVIVSIVYTQKSIKASISLTQEQIKAQMFSEYTRRYNEIFLKMPILLSDGKDKLDDEVLKYTRLYFDLCSEEYHLWAKGMIDSDVFDIWKEGMQTLLKDTTYFKAWQLQECEYNLEFIEFFQHEVVDKEKTPPVILL